jgi:hypothetical protein
MKPIRIGLLLDGSFVARWFSCALEQMLSIAGAELVVAVLCGAGDAPDPGGGPGEPGSPLLRGYLRWDRRRHVPPAEDALAPVPLDALLRGVERVTVTPRRSGSGDGIGAEDLGRIAACAPDLLIQGGSGDLAGGLLALPRFGVWSYRHGDADGHRIDSAGFWETLRGAGVAGSALERIDGRREARRTLARTISPASSSSPAVTRNRLLWDSVPLLALCLRRLLETGDPAHHTAAGDPPERTGAAPGPLPTLRMIARFLRVRGTRMERLVIQHWTIGTAPREPQAPILPLGGRRWNELRPPRGHSWADPCLFEEAGEPWLFFEDFSYAGRKGAISCVRLGPDGRPLSAPRVVLAGGHHVSNPLVFRLDGKIWMLPETARDARVALYEAIRFPHEWQLASVPLEGRRIVDPVLFRRSGTYWLLGTGLADHPGSRTTHLEAWHAPSLSGPWTPHRMNPIVADCRFGRAAGRVFERDGAWIRPAQDSSGGYGRAINFLEIVDLDPERYRERLVERIDPSEVGAEGVHTFTFCPTLVAIDMRRSRFRRAVGA